MNTIDPFTGSLCARIYLTSTGWLRAVIFILLVNFARAGVKLTELVLLCTVSSPVCKAVHISYNPVSIKAEADSV